MRTNHVVLVGLLSGAWLSGMAGCGGDDTADNPSSSSSAAVSSSGAGGSSSSSSSGSSSSSSSSGTGGQGTGGEGGTGGAGPMGDWTCLGTVMWPAPVKATITLDASFVDFNSMAPFVGLTVKACAKADTACAAPLDTQTTDANGAVKLTVPTGTDGFDGYADITGPDIPNSIAFVFPYVGDDNAATVPMLSSGTLDAFAALTGVALDDTRGHIAAQVIDCSFTNPAPGVGVTASTADASSSQIYVKNNLPNGNATETDETGVTGIFNLPAGPVDLTGKVSSSSQTTGKITVLTRAKTITYTTLPPTP